MRQSCITPRLARCYLSLALFPYRHTVVSPQPPSHHTFPYRCLSLVGSAVKLNVDGVLELDVEKAKRLISKMRRERTHELAINHGEELWPSFESTVTVKVSVDHEVRTLLKLAARERRGRLLLDATDATLAGLAKALETRFPVGAVPYYLQARWQQKEGPSKAQGQDRKRLALILTDDKSVATLFQLASNTSADNIHLELHVLMSSMARVKDSARTCPDVLQLVSSSINWCMVSFYCFAPIDDPDSVVDELQCEWSKMGIIGRTYVASEGINAQLAVPDKILGLLEQHMRSFVPLGGALLNLDAHRIPMHSQRRPPFDALSVRVRAQIVVDGLGETTEAADVTAAHENDGCSEDGEGQESGYGVAKLERTLQANSQASSNTGTILDWIDSGEEVSVLTWHERLQKNKANNGLHDEDGQDRTSKGTDDDVVLLDCRNAYESDVGKFQGAIPLETMTFKDTWRVLERVLANKDPRKTQVMIYCTGGVRCVKVGAYLKQRMGFENVARLQGGIVSYVRELKDQFKMVNTQFEKQSLFRGINYVFDSRIGVFVTGDVPLSSLPSVSSPQQLVADDTGHLSSVPAGYALVLFVWVSSNGCSGMCVCIIPTYLMPLFVWVLLNVCWGVCLCMIPTHFTLVIFSFYQYTTRVG